jgi:hypothetical protein
MLEEGLCTPADMVVTLKGFGQVPFLKSVSQTMITLSSPSSDLYVGEHTGVLTYYDASNNKLTEQEFDILIAGTQLFAPYFKGYAPEPGYKQLYDGPISLPEWNVKPGAFETYDLPEMRDTNEFDIITATLEFGDGTTESLKTCNCTLLDAEERLLSIKLPANYTNTSDEVLIKLSDGRVSNTYSI